MEIRGKENKLLGQHIQNTKAFRLTKPSQTMLWEGLYIRLVRAINQILLKIAKLCVPYYHINSLNQMISYT
jgi:hypothetical protein